MKKLNTAGKVIIAIGVLQLFRKDEGFYGYGGYVDKTWEILFISLAIILVGSIMIITSARTQKN